MNHGQNISRKYTVRDSIPLLFTPPKVKDRQIKSIKGNKDTEDEVSANTGVSPRPIIIELVNYKPEGPQLEKLSNEEASIREYAAIHEEPTSRYNELEPEGPQLEKLSNEEASIREYAAVHEEPTSGNNELETEGPRLEELSNEEASIREYAAVHEEPYRRYNELEPEGPQLEKLSNEEVPVGEYAAVHEEPTSGNNELECFSKNPLPIVKLPILLATQDIEFDILHAFEIPVPLEKIIKVEWSVRSLDVQVHLPSTKALFKGKLTANIELLQDNEAVSFQNLVLDIPWERVMEVHWLYPPDLSSIQQKEYLFNEKDPLHTQSHYEKIQKFADPLYYNIKQFSFVWHQDVLFDNQIQKIQFQGTVTLSVHLFQTQLINLNRESTSLLY